VVGYRSFPEYPAPNSHERNTPADICYGGQQHDYRICGMQRPVGPRTGHSSGGIIPVGVAAHAALVSVSAGHGSLTLVGWVTVPDAVGPGGHRRPLERASRAGLPSLEGAVVLLEEVEEAPYRIDRMLTQLLRSGALRGIAGIAVGQLTNCAGAASVDDVLTDRLGGLGVPVLAGLPIGHGEGQLTVPLGTPARLDASGGILVVESAVG